MEENKYTKKIITLSAEKSGIDIADFDMNELIMGMGIELEHGSADEETNVTDDCPIQTLKIVIAHMKESDTYYTDLKKVEDKGNTEDNTKEKENMEESKFSKRMKQLIGESEDESKKQLVNEYFSKPWVTPAGPKKGLLKEVDESKFDVIKFKSSPLKDEVECEESTKELYQLNESEETIDLDFLND